MAVTYSQIATTTSSSSTTITFSSIPSTYTDLVLVIEGAATGSCIKSIRFNNDSSAIYSCTVMYGTGTTTASGNYSEGYLDVVNAGSNRFTNIVQIQNYSNTTTYKNYLSRQSTAATSVEALVGLWRSTSAINRIDISASANNFGTTTTFSLYGIKSA